VTLYERFLKSAEKRFSEEDFLIDTHTQIQKLVAQNEQLVAENNELKLKYQVMEEKYTQVNINTQNNNCTQIENQYNITYANVPPFSHPEASAPCGQTEKELFRFIHPSVTSEAEKRKIHQEIENLVSHFPLPEICRYLMEMRKNNRVYLSVKPELMFEELHRIGMPDEKTPGYSMKNFRSYFNVND